MEHDGGVYDHEYYRQHVTIEGEVQDSYVHYYISGDQRNQTVYANIFLPSDVVKDKIFVCLADNGMGYPPIEAVYMRWQDPYEQAPWAYDRDEKIPI